MSIRGMPLATAADWEELLRNYSNLRTKAFTMDNSINSAVGQSPLLTLDGVYQDGAHRIRRRGMGKGSLYIRPQTRGYTVCLTGEAREILGDFMRAHFGIENSVTQGRMYWRNISNTGEVSQIIRRFGEQK